MFHIRIEPASNGFTVTYTDPKRVEENRSSDKFVDPNVTVVFTSKEALAEGISRLAPKLAEAMAKDMDFDQGLMDALTNSEDTNTTGSNEE